MRALPAAAIVFLLAIIVRVPLLTQSLWYDEMVSRLHFIDQPFSTIVGLNEKPEYSPNEELNYSPNNHILYSVVTKAVVTVLGTNEATQRLLSVLAGSAVGIALAWPLRRSAPITALLIALFASLNPWLIAFSGEARGYALLLLLGAVATNLLPRRDQSFPWLYVLVMVAAIYTVPIALVLLVGHGIALLLLRSDALLRWLSAALLIILVSAILYAPFYASMLIYARNPQRPSIAYGQFLAEVPVHVFLGHSVLAGTLITGVLLLLVMVVIRVGWRFEPAFRPHIASFTAATALALLIPNFVPTAGEVRFALWIIPPVTLGAGVMLFILASMAARIIPRSTRWPILAIFTLLSGIYLVPALYAVERTPAQPIRDALDRAHALAGDKGAIIGIYMAAIDSARVYGTITHYAFKEKNLRDAENEILGRNPQTPIFAIVFFPGFIDRDQPELAAHMRQRYILRQSFPGRVSPVLLYQRNP